MKLRFVIFAALGIALALYLLGYVGWRAVLAAALAIGWGGFAALCLCSLGLFLVLGAAWFVLQPRDSPYGAWLFVRARMVRDSASEVLPFSQLGGIALGVRAAVLQGVPSQFACASMIVDVTTELLAQIAYAALGITILIARVPRSSTVASLTSVSLTGLALATVAAGLFLAVQRHGQRLAVRVAASLLRGAEQVASGVNAGLDAIYRSPARIAASVALHLGAWLLGALAVWLAFRLIGARIDVPAVIALESLVYAIRSAAALVPNALGVQEAAYAFLAPLFGVSAELALAVSVLKRAREIAVGVPVLLLWQAAEGRHALRRNFREADSARAPS